MPPLKRKKPKNPQPHDKGNLRMRIAERAKDLWQRGEFWRNMNAMSVFVLGAGTALQAHPKEAWRATGQAAGALSGPMALYSGRRYDQMRFNYRRNPANPENLERAKKTEDPEFMRRIDHAFVRKYALDPEWAERKLRVSPVGAAYTFASARRLRKAPDSPYSVRKHESPSFHKVVKPLLQYHVGQLPESVKKEPILNRHFPKEKLNPITRGQIPKEVLDHIQPRLLDAEPQTEEEAVALSLLAGAVVRARQKDYKNNNNS